MLAQRIRESREFLGLTQGDLAILVGVSKNTVWNWENERREPRGDEIKKLASALKVNVAYLLGEINDPTPLDKPNVRKESFQYFDQWVEIPVLDPTIIACAGLGNGGMTGIYASAEKKILLPASMVGTISIDTDKKPLAVLVEGDSMEEAGIPDRSTVVINPAEPVYDGDAALVCFGLQNEWAIKWVYFNKKDGSVEIRSADSKYKPMLFTKEDIDLGFFCIIGKVTCLTSEPRKGI